MKNMFPSPTLEPKSISLLIVSSFTILEVVVRKILTWAPPRTYRRLTFRTRLHLTARALQQVIPNVMALRACYTALYFWPPAVVAAKCFGSLVSASLFPGLFLLSLLRRCSLFCVLFSQPLLLLLLPNPCCSLSVCPVSPGFLWPRF